MKLKIGMAVLPVTSKFGKSSKTRKGSCDKDNHTYTEVVYIYTENLSDLTIYTHHFRVWVHQDNRSIYI